MGFFFSSFKFVNLLWRKSSWILTLNTKLTSCKSKSALYVFVGKFGYWSNIPGIVPVENHFPKGRDKNWKKAKKTYKITFGILIRSVSIHTELFILTIFINRILFFYLPLSDLSPQNLLNTRKFTQWVSQTFLVRKLQQSKSRYTGSSALSCLNYKYKMHAYPFYRSEAVRN